MDNRMIGTGAMGFSHAMKLGMVTASDVAEMHMSDEQKDIRKKERQIDLNRRMRQEQILQNVCPSCHGKLLRGKKRKQNHYVRTWKCKSCEEVHRI